MLLNINHHHEEELEMNHQIVGKHVYKNNSRNIL